MGLSGDVDPTKDLPPVVSVDGIVTGVDENLGVVDRPEEERTRVVADDGEKTVVGIMGERLKSRQCNVGALLDVVDESMPPPSRGTPEKGEKGGNSPSRVGTASGVARSRPKKLVPARQLGLFNRGDVRRSQQIVYSSSSDDEVEENPETGEKRKRVGFLFKTAPRSMMSNILTDDDKWKLEGCSFQRRAKRADRVAGMVYLFGL